MAKVYRVFVEKKKGFDIEAGNILADLQSNVGITALEDLRIINRYDAQGLTAEEFDRDHGAMPHGGFVLRSGQTASGKNMLIEYSLKLDSNPEFTSCVLVAFARAVARFAAEGKSGAITVFDVPPAYLSPLDGAELRAHLL